MFPPLSPCDPSCGGDSRDEWERSQEPGIRKKEEFTRAVSLGLMDSLRKSRSRGVVGSASGGADSSAVICLVAIGVAMIAREHGSDSVKRIGLGDAVVSNLRKLSGSSYSDPSLSLIHI